MSPTDPPGPRPEFATLTDDDLVTGEAVALDLPAAGLGVRIASGLIDVLVTIVLLIAVVLLAFVPALRLDEALLWVAYILTLVTVFIVIPTAFETITRGRTLGKMALGLRTVRDDAGPISFQQAFVRSLIGFVEIYAFTGVPAFFSALLSARGKRLGDFAAGTFVVRERVTLRLSPPVSMPPPLAGWAAGADMASLPVGLAVAVRSFLQRAHALQPRSRHTVAAQLAEQVSAYVAPPPPPGTPPEAFLAAVLASRRDRDAARLRREGQLRARLTGRA